MRHTPAALRALIVMTHAPSLEGGAAARCAVALLEGLAARGVDCSVLTPLRHRSLPIPPGLSVEMAPGPHPGSAQVRWDRLARPLGILTRGPFAERLQTLSREVDVVHFIEAEAASLIQVVDRPAVVQLHCLARRDPRVWNPLRKAGRDSIELLRGEIRARRRARWLLVNSIEVGEPLKAVAPQAEVVVAPLALDPSHYLQRATLESSVAGLIGTARWPPTAEAVKRLLTRVWPLVLERRPEARLILAGEGMERSTFGHLPELAGVEWRGRVPSSTEFLRELGVLLYPLTSGSGAKVKVIEALALGIPVVTTPEGAEGLGGRGGVVVESEDGRLVEAVIGLCEDRQARQLAGEAAYQTFTRHHAPLPAAGPVVELYERMIDAEGTDGARQEKHVEGTEAARQEQSR
jgi:glycosyltransferase involved in cell wall biosynthesis